MYVMVLEYIMVLILLCLWILVYILITIFFFFLTFQNETIKKVYVEYVGYDLTYAFKTGGTFPAIYDYYICLVKHLQQHTSSIFFNLFPKLWTYLYGSIKSVSK